MNLARLCVLGASYAVISVAPVSARAAQEVSTPLPSAAPAVPVPVAPSIEEPAALKGIDMRMRDHMLHFQTDMRAMQVEVRHDMLAVLTPAQRSFIAATLGQLAIAEQPDPEAAARQIDAALSPAQRQAIVRIVRVGAARFQVAMTDMFAAQAAQMQTMIAQPPSPATSGGAMHVAGGFAMPMQPAIAEALGRQSAGSILVAMLLSPGPGIGTFPPLLQSTIFRPAPSPK